jgi:O-methyltransferase involved in polyketide biosynthesis
VSDSEAKHGPGGVDVSAPNVARIYDYMLGGKDNFAADREAAEQVLKAFPESRDGVRRNREFLGNAVRHLAAEAGIRQFIDIGSGLPTQKNVHEVVHEVAPEARTVYVDIDPVVCVHGRALLASHPNVAMIEGDLRRPEEIFDKAAATGLIDRDEPVAALLIAVLHFLPDPYPEVARLREMMAPGSHLVITHLSMREERSADTGRMQEVYSRANAGLHPRTTAEIDRFYGDFQHLDIATFIAPHVLKSFEILGRAGVARKP